MNTQTTSVQNSKLTVNVLVKIEQGDKVSATVLGLPEYRVVSSDRSSAIAKLEKLLAETLSDSELVSLEVEMPSKQEHPWRKFAGMYKDSELFESVLANIEANRRELNTKMANNYDEESTK
jgi:hypothetical protein